MIAVPAAAGLDPATDSFGVYFDLAGNTNCTTAGAMQPVTTYLLLMNPAGPTDAFECSVVPTGAPHILLSTVYANNGGLIDWEPPLNNWVGVCPTSYPVPESGAVLLMTWVILLQSPTELLFRIGPASIPSLPGGLPVLSGNGVLRHGAVASGSVGLPVAGINAGNCPVGDEVTSFGGVKSLFR
jgi:hypothetical protein